MYTIQVILDAARVFFDQFPLSYFKIIANAHSQKTKLRISPSIEKRAYRLYFIQCVLYTHSIAIVPC